MSVPVLVVAHTDDDCEFTGDVSAMETPDGDLAFRCPECGACGTVHPVDLPDPASAWTVIDHDDHRSVCVDGCAVCVDFRAWGECARCGTDGEARDDGLSSCCGARFTGPDAFGEDWVMEGRLYR